MHLLPIILSVLFFPKQDKVLVCQSGTAYSYHKSMCKGLNKCTHTIDKMTVAEAIKMKRTPCGYCYTTTVLPAKGGSTSSQRGATIKKGTQCSKSSRTNGFCYQHSG